MTPAAFRRLRRDLNLHQREVAERFGVLTETVNRWEKERSPLPPMAGLALQWVAHVEGLPPSALIDIAKAQQARDEQHLEAAQAQSDAANAIMATMPYLSQPEFDKPPSAMPEDLEDALQRIQDAAQITGSQARVPLDAWSAFLAATTQYYENR